mmetsp:Transcript_10557/g.19476  ORF Transcript_10557/g.19476 Transcript_10557/m.19476 type:complete len:1000 (+) Transcript_10557:96-3095(+)
MRAPCYARRAAWPAAPPGGSVATLQWRSLSKWGRKPAAEFLRKPPVLVKQEKVGNVSEQMYWGKRSGSLNTGKLAPLARAATVGVDRGTSLLTTICCDKDPMPGQGLQLTVDLRMKSAAAGQIPGHVLRRELGPRETDIVNAKMIDRAIRPLFSLGYENPIQAICTTLSYDEHADLVPLAINATSAALLVSSPSIPWKGPVASVRVGCYIAQRGKYEISFFPEKPTSEEAPKGDLEFELLLAGTSRGLILAELSTNNPVEPARVRKAFAFGVQGIRRVIEHQLNFVEKVKSSRGAADEPTMEPMHSVDVYDSMFEGIQSELTDMLLVAGAGNPKVVGGRGIPRVSEDDPVIGSTATDTEKSLAVKEESSRSQSSMLVNDIAHREDGRLATEARMDEYEFNVLPEVHGSTSVSQGGSNVLTTVTLGRLRDALELVPYCGPEQVKPFFVHYEAPPFSNGKIGRVGIDRRMMSSGEFIERAFQPVLPSRDEMPYSMRVNCEVMSSDGSATCIAIQSATSALLNSGVRLTAPIGAVCFGIAKDKLDQSPTLLVDPTSKEEAGCDFSLKLAGTLRGITALQFEMQAGTTELPYDDIDKILVASSAGLHTSVDRMMRKVTKPWKSTLSDLQHPVVPQHVPTCQKLIFSGEEASRLIGPGGATARGIEELHSVEIDIDPDEGDGGVAWVYAKTKNQMGSAINHITQVIWEPEPGEVYEDCIVREVTPRGLVVGLPYSRVDGFLHVSEFDIRRVDDLEKVVRPSDKIPVRILSVEDGRIRMSRRAYLLGKRVKAAQMPEPIDHRLAIRKKTKEILTYDRRRPLHWMREWFTLSGMKEEKLKELEKKMERRAEKKELEENQFSTLKKVEPLEKLGAFDIFGDNDFFGTTRNDKTEAAGAEQSQFFPVITTPEAYGPLFPFERIVRYLPHEVTFDIGEKVEDCKVIEVIDNSVWVEVVSKTSGQRMLGSLPLRDLQASGMEPYTGSLVSATIAHVGKRELMLRLESSST